MGYTIWPDGSTGDVLSEVNRERMRQEELKESGKFKYTCADRELTSSEKLAVLAEEFGEVAREVAELVILKTKNERPTGQSELQKRLRKELIQVAAVAVAWAESIEP